MESRPKRSGEYGLVTRDQMEEALRKEEVIADVAKQLEKDFGMWGMDITFSNNFPKAYEELYEQVYNHIMALGSGNMERMKNLLYQIDVNTSKFLRGTVVGSLEEELAHRIIERELQKVLLRRYFK